MLSTRTELFSTSLLCFLILGLTFSQVTITDNSMEATDIILRGTDDVILIANDDVFVRAGGSTLPVLTLGSSQRVGIGIGFDIPTAALDVNGDLKVRGNEIFIGDQRIEDTGINIGINAGFRPLSDNAYDIGNSSRRWQDVYAVNGIIQTSDKKDKRNIQPIKYGLKEILKLNPVQYEWKESPEQGVKLGLIAQEVQPIIHEVVKTYDFEENKEGKFERVELDRWGMYYSDLIPVLIQSIQEQQAIIEAKEERIATIEQELTELKKLIQQAIDSENSALQQTSTTLDQPAILKQNQPNPFTEATVIQYDLPKSIASAHLQITDQQGKTIKVIPIKGIGPGQIELKSGTLAAGTYFYSLIADGKVVETKQMMLTK